MNKRTIRPESPEDKIAINCEYLGLKTLSKTYRELIEVSQQKQHGFYDFLDALLQERSIQYHLIKSCLPRPYKMLNDFDFNFQPGLRKGLIMDIATMDFIARQESVLFIGDCGTGKSHLARALGLLACQKGYRVYYTTCSNMINDLNMGVYEKTLLKRMRKYINPQLLIIDEMGHDRLELEITKEAHLLFKVIDERYRQNKSLVFTTNVYEEDWADYLSDPISATAILDRIFHRSIKVEIRGKSYRQHESEQLQQKYQQH
jgi:DNA replication protein DnaC